MDIPPPLPAGAQPLPGPDPGPGAPDAAKLGLNLLAALGFTALALWLVIADLHYPGHDLLFQFSLSLPVLALYLTALTMAALVLAIFPKRIVAGAILLLILRSAMGFPLNAWTDNSTAAVIASIALLALALFYLVCSARSGFRLAHRPWLRLSHSLTLLCVGGALTLFSIPITLVGYSHATQNLMGDYFRFSSRAVTLVERVFRKGEQQVFLIGMMHIGEGSFYDALDERMSSPPEGDARRLVLTEGVSDTGRLLPDSFASGATYARWAELLHLVPQDLHDPSKERDVDAGENPAVDGVDFENADIDIAELDPSHRETLITLLEVLGETDPVKLMLASPEGVTGLDIEALLIDGLIGRRNDALMARFEELESGYAEIYIPWGAAHLTDVEKRLLALGYEEVDEIVRPIVSFWK